MVQPAQHEGSARGVDLPAPETPHKLKWIEGHTGVNDALETLGAKAGIRFPNRHENTSPSKISKSPAHEVKRRFTILFFMDRLALEQEIRSFLEWRQALKTYDEKLDYLLDRLTDACRRHQKQTPRSVRNDLSGFHLHRDNSVRHITTFAEENEAPAPPSPTLSIKHAPPASAIGADPLNTSFMTETTSFWSQANKASQEPGSPATTVGSDFAFDGANDPKDSQPSIYGGPINSSMDPDSIYRSSTSLGQTSDYSALPSSPIVHPTSLHGTSPTKRHTALQVPELRKDSIVSSKKLANTQDYFGSSMSEGTIAEVEQQGGQAPIPAAEKKAAAEADRPRLRADLDREERESRERKMRSPERAKSRIEKIPFDGLTQFQLPTSCVDLPFGVKWECHRVLQTKRISAPDLDRQWKEPRTMTTLHRLVRDLGIPFQQSPTIALKDVALYAKLRWSTSEVGPVFDLELMPFQKEDSNGFQREHGAARFLHIDVPSIYSPPQHAALDRQGQLIWSKVMEMLDNEQSFLDRQWRRFLVQPKEPTPRDPDFAKSGVRQVTFFASEGRDLDNKSLTDMLDWAVPLQENGDQRSCKAYARLELSASRSKPTIKVHPSQIAYKVEDLYPDNTADDKTFNDPDANFSDEKSDEAMTDGCCRISRWAMLKIAKELGLSYIPSVIQARFFGSKGIWYVDDDQTAELDSKPPDVLIEVAKSQAKVEQKPVDFTDAYNFEKLTINVVGWSRPARSSHLFADIMPILVAGGVPWANIASIVHRIADLGHQELLSSLKGRHSFRRYIHCQNPFREERSRGAGIEELADFPRRREEKVVRALESGFEPEKCKYVAEEAELLVKQLLDPRNKNIKAPVPRSMMLYAIADRWEILEPGEVQICLSEPFRDPTTGQSWTQLQNIMGLISRLPALAEWHVQKVKFVVRPELCHLKDVMIFSAKGPRSLASKLQGGDYDGDTFWACFEPLLVQPFRNSPVSLAGYTLEDLHIREDTRKLKDVIEFTDAGEAREHSVLRWVKENAEMRMGRDMLGTITLTHGRITYHENDLGSKNARLFLDLHHNMIDASKRGLSFSWEDLRLLKQKHKIPEMKEPAHRQFTGGADSNEAADMMNRAKPKPDESIVDYVFFTILEKKAAATLLLAHKYLQDATWEDEDLLASYDSLHASVKGHSAILSELELLKEKFTRLKHFWKDLMAGCSDNGWKTWDSCVEQIRQAFKDIVPDNLPYFTDILWLRPIGDSPSMWDLVKALALAKRYSDGKMMFYAAGHELCWLKALCANKTRLLDMPAYQCLLPTKRKRDDAEDGDDMEYGDDDALLAVLGTTTEG